MIHSSVKIHDSAVINCKDITIGAGGIIGADCVIEGNKIVIGRDFWMDVGAVIGGGSCHDPCAFLEAGDFLHMGRSSQLNIARGLTIGDEVGIGIHTHVFTHGAYLNELEGYPVQFAGVNIGSRVWLPNAWVNPGVTIGDDVVVAARSLINTDIPGGSLAGGSPAKIIKSDYYPKQLPVEKKQQILERIREECQMLKIQAKLELQGLNFLVGTTVFDCENYTIQGLVTEATEKVRNQLRRHGIRFRFSPGFDYKSWDE